MNKYLLLGTCLLTLNGCMSLLFPYEKPETPQPETFREAETPAINPTATPVAPWPDAKWWEQFGSPELTSLTEVALAHNNDIGAAVARLRQANALVTINRAPLLPSIGLSGNITKTDSNGGVTPVNNGVITTGGASKKTRLNTGLNASYEIDFWGKNYSALQAAQASRDASEYDAQVVRLTVTSSVATVYMDLLANEQRLAIAKENLANANSLLESLRKRYENGIISELEVTQQESVVANQTANMPSLELQRSKDLDALAILLGTLPESLKSPNGDFAALTVPVVPEGLSSELLTRRPDVKLAEANLKAAHADINAARAALLPSISLTGTAGYVSTALNKLIEPGSFLSTIGGSLAQPIFRGGALVGGIELSQAQYDELLEAYRKAIISAFSDTEDSLATVKQTTIEQSAREDVLKSAEKGYQLSQQQFQGGITDITSVLTTQTTLFNARDALIQSKLARMQAIAGLYKSFGGGWQEPEKK